MGSQGILASKYPPIYMAMRLYRGLVVSGNEGPALQVLLDGVAMPGVVKKHVIRFGRTPDRLSFDEFWFFFVGKFHKNFTAARYPGRLVNNDAHNRPHARVLALAVLQKNTLQVVK